MKVAFLDIVHPKLMDGLTEHDFECLDMTQTPKETILQRASEIEGIVIRSRFPLDQAFLSKLENLKFIARSGAGMENIDIPYCEERGIKLFSAPEGNRNAVAEHALGMLLSLFNQLIKADKEVRDGVWDREGNRGIELEGKVVGIIGYGNNGSAFAKLLQGFDVDVLAYDKYKLGFGQGHVKEAEWNELLHRADIVSLHVPQNEETIGLVDQEFMAKMKKPFYLINLSRGKIVNTQHLLDGINSGKILGACLDVLEYEKASFENMFEGNDIPESFKELLTSKKVIFSPHVGGWSYESYKKLSAVLLSKILSEFNQS